ncbi:hypothetical protein V6N13_118576 [Hibiscus sabdariffa]
MYDAFVVQQALWADGFRVKTRLIISQKNKKLKIWAILDNVPLVAWNESIFTALANRWGSFISMDADTAKKNRLDQARILMGVSQVSDVPDSTNIFINGVSYRIKIFVVGFEDQRCWIDDLVPNDMLVENQNVEGVNSKFEVIEPDINEVVVDPFLNSIENRINNNLADVSGEETNNENQSTMEKVKVG